MCTTTTCDSPYQIKMVMNGLSSQTYEIFLYKNLWIYTMSPPWYSNPMYTYIYDTPTGLGVVRNYQYFLKNKIGLFPSSPPQYKHIHSTCTIGYFPECKLCHLLLHRWHVMQKGHHLASIPSSNRRSKTAVTGLGDGRRSSAAG